MMVHMVLNVVLWVVDDFVVHDLGFREFEDNHGTCEQKNIHISFRVVLFNSITKPL